MKLCTETITLYCPYLSSGETAYARVEIGGVSWFHEHKAAITSKGLQSADTVTVRIPEGSFPAEPVNYAGYNGVGWTLHEGMTVCRGSVAAQTPVGLEKQLGRDVVKTLSGFTDNRRARAPHVKLVLI